MRRPLLFALLTVLLSGCVERPTLTPPPPRVLPRPPDVLRPPDVSLPERKEPPPRLTPEIGTPEENRLREQVQGKIAGAMEALKKITPERLSQTQRETYDTVQSFVLQAREALALKDFSRALTLAQKATLLATELSR